MTEEKIGGTRNIRSVWWAGVSIHVPLSADDASLLERLAHPGIADHFTEQHHENGRRGYAVPNAGFLEIIHNGDHEPIGFGIIVYWDEVDSDVRGAQSTALDIRALASRSTAAKRTMREVFKAIKFRKAVGIFRYHGWVPS